MAKAAREALRAYVYLDLSFLSVAQMVIVVGNSGNKVAGKVTVALIGSNSEKLAALVRDLPLAAGIGHLSPGSTRRYLVGVKSADLLPKGAPAAKFDFEITYHDGARVVTDRQSFDLEGYRSALGSGYGEPLTEIVTQLREIAQNMPRETLSILPPPRKACPYCGTMINGSAKKCHGCLEWLPGTGRRAARARFARTRRGRSAR
jgi:hypothetical protein